MPKARKIVCVIDDDDDMRMVLRDALALEEYDVIEASDGAQALSVLRQQRPAACVLLLDLMMPGMNGWEFRRRQLADAALSSIPVIVFSGAGNVADAARDLDVAAYVAKPVDLEKLLATILTHCGPPTP